MPQMWILMDNSFKSYPQTPQLLGQSKKRFDHISTRPATALFFFQRSKKHAPPLILLTGKSKSSVQVLTARLVVMAVD